MFVFLTVFKSANGTLGRGTPTGKNSKKKKKKKKKETKKKYEECLETKRQTVSVLRCWKETVPVLIASVDVRVQS